MEYGILSIIPAVLAIALAMITKNIVVSLAISVFVGSTIICGWNPIAGFLEMTHTHIFSWFCKPCKVRSKLYKNTVWLNGAYYPAYSFSCGEQCCIFFPCA